MSKYKFDKRPTLHVNDAVFTEGAGPISYVETVTLSTVAQTLSDQGVSFITYGTSGKASDAILPDPPAAGASKVIAILNGTTSLEANVNLATTARVFWGTTFNTVTVASTDPNNALELVAVSTTQWAVKALSSTSHWTFSASTGSTGMA